MSVQRLACDLGERCDVRCPPAPTTPRFLRLGGVVASCSRLPGRHREHGAVVAFGHRHMRGSVCARSGRAALRSTARSAHREAPCRRIVLRIPKPRSGGLGLRSFRQRSFEHRPEFQGGARGSIRRGFRGSGLRHHGLVRREALPRSIPRHVHATAVTAGPSARLPRNGSMDCWPLFADAGRGHLPAARRMETNGSNWTFDYHPRRLGTSRGIDASTRCSG